MCLLTALWNALLSSFLGSYFSWQFVSCVLTSSLLFLGHWQSLFTILLNNFFDFISKVLWFSTNEIQDFKAILDVLENGRDGSRLPCGNWLALFFQFSLMWNFHVSSLWFILLWIICYIFALITESFHLLVSIKQSIWFLCALFGDFLVFGCLKIEETIGFAEIGQLFCFISVP